MEADQLKDAPPATLDIPVVRGIRPGVETRSDADGSHHMAGHFSVFDAWYEINSLFEGRFLERVAAGSFKRTFDHWRSSNDPHRISVLLEHGFDPTVGDKPLGVPDDLREDDTGAFYDVTLFDTSYTRDLVPALAAGAYGASFRFNVLHDEWVEEPDESDHNPRGIPERTIKEARVHEFGPTVFPASAAATAGLRSASLTDRYYEHLRQRNPEQHDEMLHRAHDLRTSPKVFAVGEPASNTEDPPESRHSEDPPEDGHSEDPPEERHSEADTPESDETRSDDMSETDTMSVAERQARQAEIKDRLKDIDTEHNGAELPADVRAEWDRLNDEYERHTTAIADATARRQRLATLFGDDTEPGEERGAPKLDPPNVRKDAGDIYDLAAYRTKARSVDELPQLYRDGAMRAVERSTFPGVERREDAQRQVERLLDKVDDKSGTLARRILVTGSPVYQRAFGKAVESLSLSGLSNEEQRALSLGVDTAGGHAVPFQLDPTVILTSDGSINPLRQISRVEQIVGKEWQGVTSEGIVVSRAAEAEEAGDNAPSLDQPVVRPTRVQGFVPFTVEIDQDWNQLRSEMTRLLNDAKEQEEAAAFVNGTGSGNFPGGVVETLHASSHVATTTASSFVKADLYAVKNALPPRFRSRGRWAGETSIYDEVRQFEGEDLLVDSLQDGIPSRMLGYPLHEVSTMDSTVEDDAEILLFGDFQQFLIVDRIGMMVELVPHLFGSSNRFPTGQRGIFALWRNSSRILTDNAFRLLVVGS